MWECIHREVFFEEIQGTLYYNVYSEEHSRESLGYLCRDYEVLLFVVKNESTYISKRERITFFAKT